MSRIYLRPAASSDLIAHTVYLAEHAGDAVAQRFLDGAASSFEALLAHPEIGAPVPLSNPVLAGMRKWPVSGFENHLIFYLPRNTPGGGVSIIRVLHAATDWWGLLGLGRR